VTNSVRNKRKRTKEIGLFKYTKSDKTTEHVSEKLASNLAGLLGLKCAKIEIGKYKLRIGSMSYLINTKTEILIEGIYLIFIRKNKINEWYIFRRGGKVCLLRMERIIFI